MSEDLSRYFTGGWILCAIIVASFIAWSQLRDRPAWDGALFGAASLAMAISLGLRFALGSFAGEVFGFALLPSLFIYLWFAGLWGARRERAAIHRWGARHGYRITSLDPTYSFGPGLRRLNSGYRIVARRLSDGQIRVGRILTGSQSTSGSGFDVLWEGEVAPHPLHAPPPPSQAPASAVGSEILDPPPFFSPSRAWTANKPVELERRDHEHPPGGSRPRYVSPRRRRRGRPGGCRRGPTLS